MNAVKGDAFDFLKKKSSIPTDPVTYLKCGEIYWNEKFQVNCIQCNNYFTKIAAFLNHILNDHLKIKDNNRLEEFLFNDSLDIAVKSENDLFLNDKFQNDRHNLNDEIFCNEIEKKCKVDLNENEKKNENAPEQIKNPDLKGIESVDESPKRMKINFSPKLQFKNRQRNTLRNCLRKISDTSNENETKLSTFNVKKKTIKNEKVACEICGKVKNKRQMKTHLKSHDNSRYIHKCEECSKTFISEKSLELHQKSYHIADGRHINCTYEKCKRKFVTQSCLKEHLKSHINPTERPFKCELCPDKGFLYEKKLNTHIKIYHVNGKHLKCDECDRTFYLEYNLNRHKLVHKNKIKPFECDECPSRFVSYQNLSRHKKNHADIKDYPCEICKKEFGYFQAYRAHLKCHGIICSVDPKKKMPNV